MDTQFISHAIEGGVLLSLLGLMWKVGTDSNSRSQTLFKRFDDYKREVKNEHVHKDVCKIIHENMNRDIQEIKTDVKTLINREIK